MMPRKETNHFHRKEKKEKHETSIKYSLSLSNDTHWTMLSEYGSDPEVKCNKIYYQEKWNSTNKTSIACLSLLEVSIKTTLQILENKWAQQYCWVRN